MSMLEDSKGFIWFGTDNGVSRWDGTKVRNYYTKDGLVSNWVTKNLDIISFTKLFLRKPLYSIRDFNK